MPYYPAPRPDDPLIAEIRRIARDEVRAALADHTGNSAQPHRSAATFPQLAIRAATCGGRPVIALDVAGDSRGAFVLLTPEEAKRAAERLRCLAEAAL